MTHEEFRTMNAKLLWADRDREFTSIGRRYLASHGLDVTTTDHAVACLDHLKQAMPDVLVLDDELKWGGLDGILSWLREELPPGGCPVVVVSGDGPPEKISARSGVPAAFCLQKPYRMEAIVDAVAEELDGRATDGSQRYENAYWRSTCVNQQTTLEKRKVKRQIAGPTNVSDATSRAGQAQSHGTQSSQARDEELAHAVHAALHARDHGRLRRVTVQTENGRVQLGGRVRSYYAKQLAQTVAMSVEGVEGILNELVVE